METEWIVQLKSRLQEDDTYRLWESAARKVESELTSSLTEKKFALLLEYITAVTMRKTLEVEYAYELGLEHGRLE